MWTASLYEVDIDDSAGCSGEPHKLGGHMRLDRRHGHHSEWPLAVAAMRAASVDIEQFSWAAGRPDTRRHALLVVVE